MSARFPPIQTPRSRQFGRLGYTPGAAVLARRAHDGKAFFDTNAKLYSDLGATGDYKRLFALHTGLATLQALAARRPNEGASQAEKARTHVQFTRGLEELKAFFAAQKFEDLRLAQGDRVDAAQTTLALPSEFGGLSHRHHSQGRA